MLRHDLHTQGTPSEQTGLSFFHVDDRRLRHPLGAGQRRPGTTWHPSLLRWVSQAMTDFQRDLEALGIADKVVTVTYSEFGRRIEQNDSGRTAGTDHGTANCMLVMGDATVLNGGVLRPVPELSNPDDSDNMKIHVDFRQVYATVIDQWLSGNHVPLLGLLHDRSRSSPRAAAADEHDRQVVRGPCAPMTSACSMSAVFEGPATKTPKPGPGKRSRA